MRTFWKLVYMLSSLGKPHIIKIPPQVCLCFCISFKALPLSHSLYKYMLNCPAWGQAALHGSYQEHVCSSVQQSFWVRHPFLAPSFFSENVFSASYGPSSVLVCSVSALSLMRALDLPQRGTVGCWVEPGELLGSRCATGGLRAFGAGVHWIIS